jgi:hypothetical protein
MLNRPRGCVGNHRYRWDNPRCARWLWHGATLASWTAGVGQATARAPGEPDQDRTTHPVGTQRG